MKPQDSWPLECDIDEEPKLPLISKPKNFKHLPENERRANIRMRRKVFLSMSEDIQVFLKMMNKDWNVEEVRYEQTTSHTHD